MTRAGCKTSRVDCRDRRGKKSSFAFRGYLSEPTNVYTKSEEISEHTRKDTYNLPAPCLNPQGTGGAYGIGIYVAVAESPWCVLDIRCSDDGGGGEEDEEDEACSTSFLHVFGRWRETQLARYEFYNLLTSEASPLLLDRSSSALPHNSGYEWRFAPWHDIVMCLS